MNGIQIEAAVIAEDIKKHLPGKHAQQSHAGGGSRVGLNEKIDTAAKGSVVWSSKRASKLLTDAKIKRAIGEGGYSEFASLLKGKMPISKFIDFVAKMNYSQPSDRGEAKIANIFSRAVDQIGFKLNREKLITDEQYEKLSAANPGEYDVYDFED